MKLRDYPTPLAGTALGVAGITLFWSVVIHKHTVFSQSVLWLGFCIATLLMLPVLMKFIRHPATILADIKHPTIGSVVPTLTMVCMLLSHGVNLFFHDIAIGIWLVAITAHTIFLLMFICVRVYRFDLNHIVPSYFVPPIGIVVACLTVPSPSLIPIANIIVIFGLLSYAIMLPLVIYRLSLGKNIEDARKPTLAVLAAPASLTLAGYLTISTTPNPLLVMILMSIAILMTVSVYCLLLHLLRLPYSPAYSALTFPLAISATALLKISHWAITEPLFMQYAHKFFIASLCEGTVAAVVILWVVGHTFCYLKREIFVK